MTQTQAEQRGGIIGWVQGLPRPLRVMIFFGGMIAIIALVFGVTALLYYLNVRSFPRGVPIGFQEGITSSEFITFADDDAYPAALAIAPDGTLYTGSFISGAIWQASPDAALSEIAGTRERIGSVIGLDVAADSSLYVLDRVEALSAAGAVIWRIADGELTQVGTLPAEGTQRISLPNDIAVDAAGNFYVTDVDSSLRRIWRFAPGEASGEIWWIAPEDPANPAGLAYDSANNRLLVTEVARDLIYAIPLDAESPADATEILYRYEGAAVDSPGFNGITAAPDGTIYVAELGQNEVSRLEDGELLALAGGYRGSSDIAYDVTMDRLFVNNWDQSWLTPVQFFLVRFYVEPRLPFSIDAVEFGE